ncbi:hypothetical protein GX411_01450 [Candidatus Fermentibacteria bacterium]|nr:hypothetical protein [Candidatus Fermentibacteria bacterium]
MLFSALAVLMYSIGVEPGSAIDTPSCSTLLIIAMSPIDVYERPDSTCAPWSILLPGQILEILVTTADGWLGFDPGVAQAGNSGSFRYRWIKRDASFTIASGDPDMLEVVWGPSAGFTYVMTFEPVPVFLEPDSLSEIVDSLPCCSAAAITCRIPGWYGIDPVKGPHPGTIPGWVSETAVSINGVIEDVPLRSQLLYFSGPGQSM